MSEYFDVSGEDDEVGALLNRASGRASGRPTRRALFRPSWLGPAGTPPGVAMPSEELDFLPFSPVTLTSTSLDGPLIALPQRPFRGERVILSAFLQTSLGVVSDAGALVSIDPAIFCGATQIGATQGSTPISTFAATAFGVRLSFPSAGQGTRIVIPVMTRATLAVGDRIVVTGTIIGRAVR